jgi:hypothetical protein
MLHTNQHRLLIYSFFACDFLYKINQFRGVPGLVGKTAALQADGGRFESSLGTNKC